MLSSPVRSSSWAALASIPWCCVLPSVLSLASLSGATVARLWMGKLLWFLLPLCAALLGRAFWLLYVKGQGAPWSRWVTWGAAALAMALWAPRLWGWLAL